MKQLGMALVPQRGISMSDYIEIPQLAEQQGYDVIWGGRIQRLRIIFVFKRPVEPNPADSSRTRHCLDFYAYAGLHGHVSRDLASHCPRS